MEDSRARGREDWRAGGHEGGSLEGRGSTACCPSRRLGALRAGRADRTCSFAAETRGLASPRFAMACLTSC